MAATFLTIKYGTPNDAGIRPNTLSLSYPLWLLDGPPRRVQRERTLEVAVQEGAVVDNLGQDPVTFSVKLLLRPAEQPGSRTQNILNGVRRVLGHGVALEIGDEDWGDGWRLKDLREEYRKWNLPSDTGGLLSPDHGGIAVSEAAVELVLVRGVSGQEALDLPIPPASAVPSPDSPFTPFQPF